MTQDEYKKLNEYLNGCFIELEKKDRFLLNNLLIIDKFSCEFIKTTDDYDLKEDAKKENLTFEDVYILAREIVDNISSSYLPIFNTLISSGELDFSYESEYYDSHFTIMKEHELININRIFTYEDVSILIHEFMHKMNSKETMSINRYLLTEFISIYFEEYAKRYLLSKGIEKESLNLNDRIYITRKSANSFTCYSFVLFVYEKIGRIDENSYQFLNEYVCPISKEDYEKECQHFLKRCEEIKKEYKMDILYEKPYNEDELYYRLSERLFTGYRYILGTVLAHYALKHCDKEKIVYLSNHINDEKFAHMSPLDCLKTIGIDIQNIEINEFMDIIKEELQNNLGKKK